MKTEHERIVVDKKSPSWVWALQIGIAAVAIGLSITSIIYPVYAVAALAFAVAGVGNGLVLVHERLLLQTVVGDEFLGRVFGLKESASSWGWLAAFLMAGALFGFVDTRVLLALGGVGGMTIAAAAAWSLRSTWRTEPQASLAPPLPELVDALSPEPVAERAPSAV